MDERRRAQRFDDFDSYMRFDNTYEDQITGITGVPVNAVTSFFTTDRFTGSNAVRFIAPTGGFTYSYIDYGHDPNYSLSTGSSDKTNFTLSFALQSNVIRGNFLIQKRGTAGRQPEEWQVFQQSSGNVSLIFYNITNPLSNFRVINFPVGFGIGYKKIDIVRDNASYFTYVDGVNVINSVTDTGTYSNMGIFTQCPLRIGAFSTTNGSVSDIDCFSISNKSLSASEILYRYNVQLQGNELR